ncbi:MAG: ferredoxin oxidoreductase [Candidatus Shapirobacteria bacterium]|nr:ferredoxin oxidoreductase [Candidatus Shapirobacteria bacterium]
MKQFLMGNQILAQAAKDAGAKIMFGYPITPSTEILETWAKFCLKDKSLSFLQTEDEMAAGFGVIGSCLAGVPAFTATAGPGNILMQDAFVMAEALRIPMVSMIMQRGGMSTSTVIYSQEEVRLTCFGGNSEGFRIVYSTSNLQELYDYTLKAFQVAWKYRWPTFVLADGYQGKMQGEVEIRETKDVIRKKEPILTKGVNLRNCYNLEEEIGEIIVNYSNEYNKVRGEIEEYENYQVEGAKIILLAHGIVGAAAKMAVDELRKKGLSVGLFRPITLRPFPTQVAAKIMGKAEKIIVIESAIGQLSELFKAELFGLNTTLIEINKPALGFTPEEIVEHIRRLRLV